MISQVRPISDFDCHHSSSFLESRCLILATTSSGTPSSPPSAPELGDIPHARLDGDEDTLDHASVNPASRSNTIAILERPPPTPLSATIASLSQQESDAELTEDPPPLASHGQYEVV